MPLRDVLRKRNTIREAASSKQQRHTTLNPPVTFLRTDSSTEEVIYPPSFPGDDERSPSGNSPRSEKHRQIENVVETPDKRRPIHPFRKRSSTSSVASADSSGKSENRLSSALDKLHIGRGSRAPSGTSPHVPADLPNISGSGIDSTTMEVEWERRAVLLARQNEMTAIQDGQVLLTAQRRLDEKSGRLGSERMETEGPGTDDAVDADNDIDIQEAIRLHEEGDLERSTAMFGRLGEPAGANDPLAQVLYGMALQHGWGIATSPQHALHYHTLAAANSAAIESTALLSGSAYGGPAKGELVLAIYELGNAFRHGWGCEKDAVAARRYYECAAELGDVDAMVEIAWCWENGFGGDTDKFKAARYLRLADERGRKEVGNSWIWKDKYGGPRRTK